MDVGLISVRVTMPALFTGMHDNSSTPYNGPGAEYVLRLAMPTYMRNDTYAKFCARWAHLKNMSMSRGEPPVCYLFRHRKVQGLSVSHSLLANGSAVEGFVQAGGERERNDDVDRSAGLYLIVSHRHDKEYTVHARVMTLSSSNPLVSNASLLIHCNNVGHTALTLLSHLRLYPMRHRHLIRTALNVGYRCGHVHALALTARVWAQYPWVLSLSGPDIYLTPRAFHSLDDALRSTRGDFHIDMFYRCARVPTTWPPNCSLIAA